METSSRHNVDPNGTYTNARMIQKNTRSSVHEYADLRGCFQSVSTLTTYATSYKAVIKSFHLGATSNLSQQISMVLRHLATLLRSIQG